jgi:hypothetical protein
MQKEFCNTISPEADMLRAGWDVRFVPKGDMAALPI